MGKFGNITIHSDGGGVALGDYSIAFGRDLNFEFKRHSSPQDLLIEDPEIILSVREMLTQLNRLLTDTRLPGAQDAISRLSEINSHLTRSPPGIDRQEVATALQSVCSVSGIASNITSIAMSIGIACGLIAN